MIKNYTIINRMDSNNYLNSVLIKEKLSDGFYAYFEITLNTTHEDGKLKKGDGYGKNYFYQIRRFENDHIANYISDPFKYITEQMFKDAKKILNKNFTLQKKIHSVGEKFIHYYSMFKIVEHSLKSYHDDFYWHDVFNIGMKLSNNEKIDFIWIVREHGTNICQLNDIVYNATIQAYPNAKIYHVTEKTIRPYKK